MDRRSQQNHIRAAQDWLGRADDSLSQKNDVQGDLKLMLAKAELAHVGNCPRSRRLLLWGRRLMALLVATGIAAVIWQPFTKESVPADPAMAENAVTTAAQQSAEPEDYQTARTPEPKYTESDAQPQESYPSKQETAERPKAVQAAGETKQAVSAAEPQLPDAAKQQLMQSAGKILRQ